MEAEAQVGIKILRRNINNLRYADDTTLMTKSQTQLKRLGIHDEIYASVLTHFFTPFGPWEGIMNLEEAVSSAKSNFWR